ncbi:MAG TPA: DUF2723 domain-containing protein [Vicinamibacterales bacterium]|nr:DUF2723 domain-containing protein [Vicinamibacterales bacterium]
MKQAAAASVAALIAFLLYYSTLLPGFDFGDTPSFQVMAGDPAITPRDGYPLFFAFGDSVLWTTGGDPAHAFNLSTAIAGAAAVGVLVLAATEISGSVAAALAAAAMFGGSYTFWSQSVIAEVYALNILFVALSFLVLFRWEANPTTARLAVFCGVYALGFGTHLGMILLAPAFAMFVMWTLGVRRALSPRIVLLAAGCAVAGAAQYLWNLRSLWLAPLPPSSLGEALRTFWNDVTKADWRDTMVLNVPRDLVGERARMYVFDVSQQFGWLGPLLALAGIWYLGRRSPRRFVTLAAAYVSTLAFALTYNVGDTHVFLLPSHLILALTASAGVVGAAEFIVLLARGRMLTRAAVATIAVLAGVIIAGRAFRDFPALDRSEDHRMSDLLQTLTDGMDDRSAILVADLNWQIGNGLNYFTHDVRTDVATVNLADIIDHVPQLIRDNAAVSRRVAATERAAVRLKELLPGATAIAPDLVHPSQKLTTLSDAVRSTPPRTRYVLTVLRPTRDMSIDRAALAEAIRTMTGESVPDKIQHAIGNEYTAIAGVSGQPPALVESSARPFSRTVDLNGAAVTVRMDSWLAFDTIRRMGFGHAIVNRRHTLIVERGVSLVFFDENGEPLKTAYAGSIFEPQPRYYLFVRPS